MQWRQLLIHTEPAKTRIFPLEPSSSHKISNALVLKVQALWPVMQTSYFKLPDVAELSEKLSLKELNTITNWFTGTESQHNAAFDDSP